jgi:hypothetical protein
MTPSRRITIWMCLCAHEFLREAAQGHSRSWQPVTAIHAEGDILIVCEWFCHSCHAQDMSVLLDLPHGLPSKCYYGVCFAIS